MLMIEAKRDNWKDICNNLRIESNKLGPVSEREAFIEGTVYLFKQQAERFINQILFPLGDNMSDKIHLALLLFDKESNQLTVDIPQLVEFREMYLFKNDDWFMKSVNNRILTNTQCEVFII
jgi:hypothetical protein